MGTKEVVTEEAVVEMVEVEMVEVEMMEVEMVEVEGDTMRWPPKVAVLCRCGRGACVPGASGVRRSSLCSPAATLKSVFSRRLDGQWSTSCGACAATSRHE